MYQSTYYMSKSSGTHADTLAAFGLAAVLEEVLNRTRGRQRHHGVKLSDAGPYYEVSFQGGPLSEAEVVACDFFPAPGGTGYPIAGGRAKPGSIPADTARPKDVDETWDEIKRYAERRRELRDAGRRGSELEEQLQDFLALAPEAPVITWLGDGRMQAQEIYNGILGQWAETRQHFTANLKAILRMCASPEPDMEVVTTEWGRETGITRKGDRTVTASQLFNPHQGKGLNQPKANALRMDNVKDAFWLLEFLKACGLWLAAAPRQSPDRERKTYVLSPLRLTLRSHAAVFTSFTDVLWSQRQRDITSLKLDITSLLLYLRALLEYSEAGQKGEDEELELLFRPGFGPEQVISGMHVVQYKLLSQQAYTVTHMGFLALPRWTRHAKDRAAVVEIKEVIEEHLRVIQGIDEGHSDGYDLLRRYRSFVAGGQWEAFFDFAVGYSNYLMRQWDAGRWPWAFSTILLRRLIMNADKPDQSLTQIVESEGFQNIAYAIRHSTIVPQGQLARFKQGKGEKPIYDVRYGLGQSLRQKANDAREFLAALGDFLSNYSAETYQTLESKGQRRRSDVQKSDLDEITRLVDRFGPEVVCNLLVAYGYASDFPKADAQKPAEGAAN